MAKEQNPEMRADDTLDDEGLEPRVYEIGFHLDPELPIEEVKKTYQSIRALITNRGVFVAEGEPEKIQLAYTISRQEVAGRRDFDSAYFSWIVYETSTEHHTEILKAASSEKSIIRFIDLHTTKDVARHAVEVRELSLRTSPERAENIETAANAELDAALESVVI